MECKSEFNAFEYACPDSQYLQISFILVEL